MKTFPFYYPVFNNRGRKGSGGAPTDRSPRPLLRVRSGALIALAITAAALVPGGHELAKGQTPTPPPVVTPAPVPGGVTVVAPAGSVVSPAGNVVRPSGPAVTNMGSGMRPAGGAIVPSSTPIQVSGGTVLPPSSGIRPAGPAVTPNGTVIQPNGPTVVPGGPGPGPMNDSRYSVGGPQAQTPGTNPPPVAVQGNATVTPNGVVITNGVVDAYEPGTRFVMRDSSGPVSYTYSPQTAYYTAGGQVLTAEQVRVRIRAGLPVRMEYLPQGNTRVIHRVVVDDRYLND